MLAVMANSAKVIGVASFLAAATAGAYYVGQTAEQISTQDVLRRDHKVDSVYVAGDLENFLTVHQAVGQLYHATQDGLIARDELHHNNAWVAYADVFYASTEAQTPEPLHHPVHQSDTYFDGMQQHCVDVKSTLDTAKSSYQTLEDRRQHIKDSLARLSRDAILIDEQKQQLSSINGSFELNPEAIYAQQVHLLQRHIGTLQEVLDTNLLLEQHMRSHLEQAVASMQERYTILQQTTMTPEGQYALKTDSEISQAFTTMVQEYHALLQDLYGKGLHDEYASQIADQENDMARLQRAGLGMIGGRLAWCPLGTGLSALMRRKRREQQNLP
jgi:hypothetical protein